MPNENSKISIGLAIAIFIPSISAAFLLGGIYNNNSTQLELNTLKDNYSKDMLKVEQQCMEKLKTTVSFIDTDINRGRIDNLRDYLAHYDFVYTNRFSTSEDLSRDINSKPDIIVAHWHAYRNPKTRNSHDPYSENKLVETLKKYFEINPKINIIIFSSTFGNNAEEKRCKDIVLKKIPRIKLSLYELDYKTTNNQISLIDGEIVSIATKKVNH